MSTSMPELTPEKILAHVQAWEPLLALFGAEDQAYQARHKCQPKPVNNPPKSRKERGFG